jgi:hypothetical protein
VLISISRIILGHCWRIIRISCLGVMYVCIYIYIYITHISIYIYIHKIIYRNYIEYLINLVSNMVPGSGNGGMQGIACEH